MTTNEAFEKWYDSLVMVGNTETVAEWAWQAATAEANKRITELESEMTDLVDARDARVAELESELRILKELRQNSINYAMQMQASNNQLREALEETTERLQEICDIGKGLSGDNKRIYLNRQLLQATPAESLQAFENEVIEKCADICDEHGCVWVSKIIRALKEVK